MVESAVTTSKRRCSSAWISGLCDVRRRFDQPAQVGGMRLKDLTAMAPYRRVRHSPSRAPAASA
jgi:hypothetical protein